MGRRGQELEFPFSNVIAIECSGGIAAIENHQLVAAWQPEAGSDIVEKGGRIAVPIVLELPAYSNISLKVCTQSSCRAIQPCEIA